MQKKRYDKPELLELGPAAALTLGSEGCTPDGMSCKLDSPPPPFTS